MRHEDEIVLQGAVAPERLRADARAARRKVFAPDLGHELLQRLHERGLPEGAVDLPESHPAVPCGEAPDSGIRRLFERVAEIERCLPITLARERRDRVRPRLGAAADEAREVDTQERKPRVGHRIEKPFHEPLAPRRELVILAAERDEPHARVHAVEAGDAVCVEAGAGRGVPRDDFLPARDQAHLGRRTR